MAWTSPGDGSHTETALASSTQTDELEANNGGFLAGAIHVVDGGGTGFNSGTVTMQASLDNLNWFTAKDVTGTDIAFTADAYFEFCLAARYIRLSTDGSVSDVDVHVFMT